MKLKHHGEPPTDASLAVSVILLRQSEKQLEVFIQHRVSTMDFAAGMVVFPGGRVDEVDSSGHSFSEETLTRNVQAWSQSSVASDPPSAHHDAGRLLAAAIRETTEECGLVLDPSTLIPWANWITPLGLPKRFDTYFFLAPRLTGAARHQTTEAWKSAWMSAEAIISAEAAGTLKLMLPTLTLLDELLELKTVSDAFHQKRHIKPVLLEQDEDRELLRLRRLRASWHGQSPQT